MKSRDFASLKGTAVALVAEADRWKVVRYLRALR